MSNQSQHPFKWRHFQSDIILLCVRWSLRYALSYRDLEEMMLERGLHVDPHPHYHDLSLSSMLRARPGEAQPTPPQCLHRFLAG